MTIFPSPTRFVTRLGAVLAVAAAALSAPAGAAAAETVSVPVGVDAYVSSASSSSNFGSSSLLGVDGGPIEVSYLKFDLGAYAGRSLQSASLQLRISSSGSTGRQNVKLVSSDSWVESSITYANRPAVGATVGSFGPTSTNTNYAVALNAAGIAGELGGQLSLAMDSTSTDSVDIPSSETTSGPRLVLTLADADTGGGDTTSPTVTAVSPAADATGVARSADVTATFSEGMDPGTISGSTVALAGSAGNQVAATVAYDAIARRMTIDPNADLAGDTTYTATIKSGPGGVKDSAGNAMAADRVWSFRTAPTPSGAQTVSVPVEVDAYVSSASSSSNFGSSSLLGVDGGPIEVSYLKFDLGAYAGRSLQSASLQLRVSSSGSTGRQNVKLVSNDSWVESSITYANRPAVGATVASFGPTSANTSYAVALSAAGIAGELGGQLSLAIDSTSTDGVDISSSETSSGPRLVLTLADADTPPPASDPVIAAVGDIACDPADPNYNDGNGTSTNCRQKATSDLVINQGFARVLTLGDHQYEDDRYENYLKVFDPTWGRVKDLISPVVGNREYRTPGASGYFDYFNGIGQQTGPAGDRARGYYSYDIGAWHVIALNSNCTLVSCAAGSAQEQWLRADLAANANACTLAYFHHPRFTSGSAGNNTSVQPFWQALHEARADLVLNSHAHSYERFARQTPTGTLDTTRGIREFIVGTGGKSLQALNGAQPNSEVRQNTTYGLLRLTLRPASYEWSFVPEAGASFTDTGKQACH